MDRQEQELTWRYDKEADVLYLTFGEVTPAYGDELNNDIVLLHSLDDDRIVGLTVIGYKEMGGIDALLDRLNTFVSSLRIPLIDAHARQLRETTQEPVSN